MVSHAEVMKLLSKQARYDGGSSSGGALIGGRRKRMPRGAALIGGCCCGGSFIGGCAMCGLGAKLSRTRIGGARAKRPGASARADGLKAYAARHGVSYKEAMSAAKGMNVSPSGELSPKPAAEVKALRVKAAKKERAPRAPRADALERKALMALLKDAGKKAIGCPPYGRLSDLDHIRDNIRYARALADPRAIAAVEAFEQPVGLGRRRR